MRARSAVKVFSLTLLSLAALVATWSTRVVAAIWLTAGVIVIGHRSLDRFPSLGLGPVWREGPRSVFVLISATVGVSKEEVEVLQAMRARTASDPTSDPTTGADLGAGQAPR